jgi:murein DD-endopeptidase MepM/ murein hydrolase activator NlpD
LLLAFDIAQVDVVSYKIAKGKTALLKFHPQKGILYEYITLGKKRFQIFLMPNSSDTMYALVPFSYYTKPQNREIVIHYKENNQEKSEHMLLKVTEGNYKKEEIHVSASKVNPKSKEVKARISEEYSEAMRIYATVTPQSYISEPFVVPLQSKITSEFGKARVYNGSLKGYHSGTDFRAKVGTPIIAANRGRVALVKRRFYSGGTVLLDHGEGIYTCYFHMSAFSVKEGEIVQRGEVLGLSGKSGRVTGPHLHFSARINAVQVDPLQLIEIMNKNILRGN